MGRPNCVLCSTPVLRDQPSMSCHKCNNIFHTHCVSASSQGLDSATNILLWTCNTCLSNPIPCTNDDKLSLILKELQNIKSRQVKSDALLDNISTSVNALNSKVSEQGKHLSSLGHSVNSLNKQLTTISKEVKDHAQRFEVLETRIAATEKTLSDSVGQPSSSGSSPSINDIAMEIQQRSICALNIIIRGAPESSSSQLLNKDSDDKIFIADIFKKLNLPGPTTSIVNAFRVGRMTEDRPRILKVVLSSRDAADSVLKSYLHLKATSPDFLPGISISRDRTFSERQSIREVYQQLRTRQVSEPNITIRYFNGLPRIVQATLNQDRSQKR